MPNLDDLRVSKNPDLVTLPPFFSGFPRLVEFYGFNCKIEVLPEELARCKILTKIMVNGNRLSSLPDAVARSAVRHPQQLAPFFSRAIVTADQVLAALDISDNKFTEVPPGLAEAADLKLFFVANNQITNLPPFLTDLPQLNRLNISGNPIDKTSAANEDLHAKLQDLCTKRGGKFHGLA